MARMKLCVLVGVCAALAVAAFIAVVLACSEGPSSRFAVSALWPSGKGFLHGDLGVVRPTFTRDHLIMAYRRLTGKAPSGEDSVISSGEPGSWSSPSSDQRWLQARTAARSDAPRIERLQSWRDSSTYGFFTNCTSDALLTAVTTLAARVERFGSSSPVVRDWLAAQDAVFENCPSPPLHLPDPPPQGADALVRADRAYQTAAAYFYAMDYDKAETLFRAIAEDRSSVWRPWGRYLAARALIRRATLVAKDEEAGGLLQRADRDLIAVQKDPTLAEMHERAAGLQGFVAAHLTPVERLHELSTRMSSARQVQEEDLRDYRMIFDLRLKSNVSYAYAGIEHAAEWRAGDDMTDWILVMQGWGDASRLRALERWRATKSPVWLVALMWKLPTDDTATSEAMPAAAAIPRGSPAFTTLAFLRVRLLLERNEKASAREVLATLPDVPGPGFPADAVNLLRGERFALARDLDELLASTPRFNIAEGLAFDKVDREPSAEEETRWQMDDDAIAAFNDRLPVSRLAEAARSPRLPPQFHPDLAAATWTRAVLLGNDAIAMNLAPSVPQAEPDIAADLKRYREAPAGARRHFAAIHLLLRHPGMTPYLDRDPDVYTGRPYTRNEFDHQGRNWWCAPVPPELRAEVPAVGAGRPPLVQFPTLSVLALPESFPEFLSGQERKALAAERAGLARIGSASIYLADEAVKWARAEPTNPLVAEALAHAVEGTRWGCYSDDIGARSKLAYQTLHRLFPDSTWAKRTKYWYNGRQ